MPIRFTQSCPTCGRRIQVQASLMGHSVACPHCRAEFMAKDIAPAIVGSSHCGSGLMSDRASIDPLMARVDKALAMAEQHPTAL